MKNSMTVWTLSIPSDFLMSTWPHGAAGVWQQVCVCLLLRLDLLKAGCCWCLKRFGSMNLIVHARPPVRRSSVVSDPEGALEVMQRQTFILKKLIKHCLVSWEVSQPRNSIIRGEQRSDHVSEGRWPPRCNHTSSRDHRARSQCSPCSERSVHDMHSMFISQLLWWQSPGSKKNKNHSSYWASFVR